MLLLLHITKQKPKTCCILKSCPLRCDDWKHIVMHVPRVMNMSDTHPHTHTHKDCINVFRTEFKVGVGVNGDHCHHTALHCVGGPRMGLENLLFVQSLSCQTNTYYN